MRVEGRAKEYVRLSDAGDERRSSFCPECGSTVFLAMGAVPGVIVVAIGAFADPGFPAPGISVWESRKHPWVSLPEEIEHLD